MDLVQLFIHYELANEKIDNDEQSTRSANFPLKPPGAPPQSATDTVYAVWDYPKCSA